MMKAMLNAMRLQAQRQASGIRQTSVGEITSYDSANFAVRVQLQAEQILTGWLPLCSPWIGNGWGMFAAPSIGDMVAVHFFGGNLEAGFVEGRLFNDEDVPLSVPSAEFWLVHKSGSFLKFTNDGDVLVNTERDLAAIVGRNLSANVTGDINVACSGNAGMTVQGDMTATVAGTLDATANSATLMASSQISLAAPVVAVSETLTVGSGASGSFSTPTGQTVTVQDGIITNIY